jgi:hypothetical protein
VGYVQKIPLITEIVYLISLICIEAKESFDVSQKVALSVQQQADAKSTFKSYDKTNKGTTGSIKIQVLMFLIGYFEKADFLVVVTDALKKKDPTMDGYDIAKLSDQAFWVRPFHLCIST